MRSGTSARRRLWRYAWREAAGIETTLNPGEWRLSTVPGLGVCVARCHWSGLVMRHPAGGSPSAGSPRRGLRGGRTAKKHTPVMLHRAMFGSLERFTGILIEHHAGKLPTWLAPAQCVVRGITNAQDKYCQEVTENLKNQGLRVETDLRYEKVGFKIREHTIKRVPYLLVAGDREAEGRTLSVWARALAKISAIWSFRSFMPFFARKSRAADKLFRRIVYRNVEAG